MTELELRRKEIEEIELTEDEIKYAILSAKVQKWNKIRNAPYWEAMEKQKAKNDGVHTVRKSKSGKQG